MKFKSELAQEFYNEMSNALYEELKKFRELLLCQKGKATVTEQLGLAFGVMEKGIEMKQSICKDAVKIEIKDRTAKDHTKLCMVSVAADHMGK